MTQYDVIVRFTVDTETKQEAEGKVMDELIAAFHESDMGWYIEDVE